MSQEANIPKDLIRKRDNFLLLLTPKGGHLEYFVTRNAVRWCNYTTASYLRTVYLNNKEAEAALAAKN